MEQVILQPPSKDTYLSENLPDGNQGNNIALYIRPQTDSNRRTILEFGLTGIPSGATIDLATLALWEYHNDINTPTIWAYKLLRTDWVELEATWNDYKASTPWTASGGDYITSDPNGDSSPAIPDASLEDWLEFDVTAIVQDALDAEIAAEFLIRFDIEAGAIAISVVFRSKEYATEANRPKLTVDYTPGAEPEIYERSAALDVGIEATADRQCVYRRYGWRP